MIGQATFWDGYLERASACDLYVMLIRNVSQSISSPYSDNCPICTRKRTTGEERKSASHRKRRRLCFRQRVRSLEQAK